MGSPCLQSHGGGSGVCCARGLERGWDWGEPGLEGTQGCSSPPASS